MSTVLLLASCASHGPAPAAPPQPSNPKGGAVLEYVGGTAIQAKDPKLLSAWYSERFGLPIAGEMPGGFYGGFEKGDKFGRFASFHDPEGNEVDVWGQ